MTVLISLIGEQPIPNLLPVLHMSPQSVLLVHTDRTLRQATRLTALLQGRGVEVDALSVSPYDIVAAGEALGQYLTRRNWRGLETVFNLTGGTKTMAFAAYELAVRLGCDFFYLQSEGGQSLMFRYVIARGVSTLIGPPEVIPGRLTIDDYLRAHLDNYTTTGFALGAGGSFEQAVHDALAGSVDEMLAGVKHAGVIDLDLVIRCGNQLGIAEVKSGKLDMKPIGQLTTAAGRVYLGTYTRRFLITAQGWPNAALKALAEARDIIHVELPSYRAQSAIDQADAVRLRQVVGSALGKPPAAP